MVSIVCHGTKDCTHGAHLPGFSYPPLYSARHPSHYACCLSAFDEGYDGSNRKRPDSFSKPERRIRDILFFRVLDTVWCSFTETITSAGGRILHPIARNNILSVLNEITVGRFTVATDSGTITFGVAEDDLRATLRVKSEAFWMRVALFTDLGLAEAFMFGRRWVQYHYSSILIANRRALTAGTDTILVWTLSKGRLLTRNKFIGNLTNSRANISAHYDLGNAMFSAFLSEDMNYSSAIFKDFNEDLDPTTSVRESLEDAQLRKTRLVLKKANILPGQRVLELGTGWGSLAILAAKMFDCTVETVTLSFNQAAFARERIEDAKLSNKITVHCMDFRECTLHPEWAGSFDRVISVEMLNHIGKDFLIEYWAVIDWALKPDTGVGVIQGICIPEARVAQYDTSVDFAQKWCAGHLVVDSVLNIGPHYSRTLREWKRKFLANWNSVIAKALVAQYNLDAEGLEIFKRKWIYYFDYSEAGCRTRTLGTYMVTFTREGNVDFGCDVEF
ncbi:CFS1-like protein [Mycena sanguinolenta]|uniref:CFS1-like protein n=1 Tax=Mycena sanguinolenta TaxID=230812 RepID=A0A8H6U385_9AGAR|nr:CFS1-like protein [Mycena sanguinolenta]